MENRQEIICVACPLGCRLSVWIDERNVVRVEEFGCKRGVTYGEQEFTNPMRMVTSLVYVIGGKRPVCSVKTKNVVPKGKIPEILKEIRSVSARAPIRIGQVIVENIADTGVDLVATAGCDKG